MCSNVGPVTCWPYDLRQVAFFCESQGFFFLSFFFLCVVLRVIPLPPKVLLTIREYGRARTPNAVSLEIQGTIWRDPLLCFCCLLALFPHPIPQTMSSCDVGCGEGASVQWGARTGGFASFSPAGGATAASYLRVSIPGTSYRWRALSLGSSSPLQAFACLPARRFAYLPGRCAFPAIPVHSHLPRLRSLPKSLRPLSLRFLLFLPRGDLALI